MGCQTEADEEIEIYCVSTVATVSSCPTPTTTHSYIISLFRLISLFIFLRVGEGYWLCFLNMKFIAHAQFPGPQHYFA